LLPQLCPQSRVHFTQRPVDHPFHLRNDIAQAGDPSVGSLDALDRLPHGIQASAESGRPVLEVYIREIVGRIVDRRVDSLSARQAGIDQVKQLSIPLERQQIIANSGAEGNVGHDAERIIGLRPPSPKHVQNHLPS